MEAAIVALVIVLVLAQFSAVRWLFVMRWLVAIAAGTALFTGSCVVFYLAYSALPPFELGEEPPGPLGFGGFAEIRRPAGSTVRYADGWAVTVEPLEELPSSLVQPREGMHVIGVRVRFTNGTRRDFYANIGGVCDQLQINGAYRSAHRERPEIRAVSDLRLRRIGDTGPLFRLAPGATGEGRLAFEVPTAAGTRLELHCGARRYKTAIFELN